MGDDRHGGVRDLSETTFRLSQSCCRPEGDQKRSDRGEKFLGYFSLRTSVVQQPETFVQNSNFANASLLRNLVLHYSFHLKTPQWKLTTRELIRSVGRRRVRPSRCRAGSSPLVSTTPTRYWGLLVISDPKKLLLWCERNASSGLNAKVWTLFITMWKWEFL